MNNKYTLKSPFMTTNKSVKVCNELSASSFKLAEYHFEDDSTDFYDKMVELAEKNEPALKLTHQILTELTSYFIKHPKCLWNTSGDELMSNVELFMRFYEHITVLKIKKQSTH